MLGILFFVWFASGLVMVYHTFPKVSPTDRLAKMDLLSAEELPTIDSVIARNTKILHGRGLTLNKYLGQAIFSSGKDQVFADSTDHAAQITSERIIQVAKLWNGSEIARIDTLNKVDQWIPFGYYDVYFPIYKFHFADEQQHQLYIASTNGDVLQYTDRDGRFWAWLGAIPHWVYFTQLRQNSSLWMEVVIWLAAIGCIMCLAGLFMSLYVSFKSKRVVPYKKTWFKWHHILGLIFGVISITFAFSGLMSLANASGWVPQPHMAEHPMRTINKGINPADYRLDYRDVLAAYPETRQIEWHAFAGRPYYTIRSNNEVRYVDATNINPKELALSQEDCEDAVKLVHGEGVKFETTYLTEPETYYIGRKHQVSLPVWRIEVMDVDDIDRSTYYINPETGSTRYVNRTSRWMHWLYPALHSLSFTWLVKYPLLWSVVMWVCMIGGAALSLTGVWLSIKYLILLFKR